MIYGSTEAGVVAAAPYDMIADVPGAVGVIVPGVDVEIVDATDRVLPIGSEGFVRVRSQVFAENMAAARSSGQMVLSWRSRLDHRQTTCFASPDAVATSLIAAAKSCRLPDLENFLLTCSGVQDAGVCTVVGATGFSEVWVGLVLAPAAEMAALRHAIESNTQFKNNIDQIFVVEVVPRGTLGKVQRDELKKMLQDIGEEKEPAG